MKSERDKNKNKNNKIGKMSVNEIGEYRPRANINEWISETPKYTKTFFFVIEKIIIIFDYYTHTHMKSHMNLSDSKTYDKSSLVNQSETKGLKQKKRSKTKLSLYLMQQLMWFEIGWICFTMIY